MTGKIIEIIIMGGTASIMFFFAYAIGVKQNMNLIAGYNEKTAQYVKDGPGLARLIGRLCLLIGLAPAGMPLFMALWGTTTRGWHLCAGHYGGFLFGVIILTILQSRDYVQSSLTG